MTPMTIRQKCISVLFISLKCLSQNYELLDTGFLEYLEKKNLNSYKLYYLEHVDDTSKKAQSILYREKAWEYFKIKNYPQCYNYFNKLNWDTLNSLGYIPLFLRCKYEVAPQSPASTKISNDTLALKHENQALLYMLSTLPPQNIDFTGYTDQIQKKYKAFYKVKNKKQVVAIALASVVPGLGKYYIGKKNDALSALSVVGVFGLQFVESYIKSGPYNWRTLIFGGLTLSFHSANIYGTFKSLKKYKLDKKKEFLRTLDEDYLDHIAHWN